MSDYREGEIPRLTADDVNGWLAQFDASDQPIILHEMERIVRRTYISKRTAARWIGNIATKPEIVGGNAADFWTRAGIFVVQHSSRSQAEIADLLDQELDRRFGIAANRGASTNSTYFYLDDAIHSGNQARIDLNRCIEQYDIRNSKIYIIAMAIHRGGQYYANNALSQVTRGRGVTLEWRAGAWVEDRRAYTYTSDVFRPTALSDDPNVNAWRRTFPEGQEYFHARQPGGQGALQIFSSETARETIEQAFLKRGAYIYSLPQNPDTNMRPLGYSRLRTPGFGSTIITYRNCPNNAPLVMWWGNPTGGYPLNAWRPLFPRRPRQRPLADVFGIGNA
ncbi:MAG TPA: hypothetical protein VGR52_05520 [Stellaceae bacterium]|nr:hypothetical protein [Stellaceae bacterium]